MNNVTKGKKELEGFFSPMVSLQKKMNEMFENFLQDFEGSSFLPWRASGEKTDFMPRIDVAEGEKEVTVNAELPGLTEKDVEVTLDHGVLTIKGEKQQEHEEKQQHYHYVERKYGSFYRRIPMPSEIEQSKVDATFKNGILRVVLPKKESVTLESKRIEVKS